MCASVKYVVLLIYLIKSINSDAQLDLPQYSTPNPVGYGRPITPTNAYGYYPHPSAQPVSPVAPVQPTYGYGLYNNPHNPHQQQLGLNPINNPPGYGIPTPNHHPPAPLGPPTYQHPNQQPPPVNTNYPQQSPNDYSYGIYPNNYYPQNNGYSTPNTISANYSPNPNDNRNYLTNRGGQNDPGNYGANIRDLQYLLNKYDAEGSETCANNVAAQWNFETNVNHLTHIAALQAQREYSDFQRYVWQQLKHINRDFINDGRLFRQLRFISAVGPSALPPDQLDRYNRLINDMLSIYNSASVCAYAEPFRCGLRLQPDLTLIMARSRDWDELAYYWSEWRRLTGTQMRDLYEQLIELNNKAAQANNFTNVVEYWTFPFESQTFRQDIEEVWAEIRPVYELLHAYVRRKLRDFYGPERINAQAPLPAHILGNMWAQQWSNILDITVPYPGKNFLDVTKEMLEQGYTPVEMFRLAEEFFVSLNMTPMPLNFWQGSVFEKPPGFDVLCQASAWDFCNRVDYRIKMCSNVNMKDLITAHHEMAHIQYFLHYRNQPKVFRDGANPGFHEAIGDAVGLSISTPQHMQTLGLVSKSVDDLAHDVNYLYSMALEKLTFLPFALVMDKWRWDIFDGNVLLDESNCYWWRLREQYSGIKPPFLRSESDFDPGSKYHIPANIPYIRYFVGGVLQFQIYRALCRAAGQFDPNDPSKPLHKCDFYRSKEAGRILSELMTPGSSLPWTETLLRATGENRLDGTAMRDYFRPLEDWLRSENLRTGEYIGWIYDGDYCKQSLETANLQVSGGYYNTANCLHQFNFYIILFNCICVFVVFRII